MGRGVRSPHPYLTLAFVAGSLIACAPRTATTTTTAADVSIPASRKEAGAHEKRAAQEAADGQLECRTKSNAEGTTELYLDWNGSSARGTLRHVAPSGNVSLQNVRAERHKGAIIAD